MLTNLGYTPLAVDEINLLKQVIAQTLATEAKEIPDINFLTNEDIAKLTLIIPHLEEVATHFTDTLRDEDLIHPYVCLHNFYRRQGRYGLTEYWSKKGLDLAEQRLPVDHPDLAKSCNKLGVAYYFQRNYTEAESLYNRAIAITEKSLSPDHPDLAISLNNLALLYYLQENYTEAESFYKRAIAIDEKSLAPDHPDLAIYLNNLASLYSDQGNYTEAELLYLRALEIRVQKLGTEHPDTIESRENLTQLWQEAINAGRAEELEGLYQHPFGQLFLREMEVETEN